MAEDHVTAEFGYKDGKLVILSGGYSCEICGTATLLKCRSDPFGKSDLMFPRCDDHRPWPNNGSLRIG